MPNVRLFPICATNGDSLAFVTPDESEQFDPEDIKRAIVEADSRYYLWPSKNPSADYCMLYFSAVFLASRREGAVSNSIS